MQPIHDHDRIQDYNYGIDWRGAPLDIPQPVQDHDDHGQGH